MKWQKALPGNIKISIEEPFQTHPEGKTLQAQRCQEEATRQPSPSHKEDSDMGDSHPQ